MNKKLNLFNVCINIYIEMQQLLSDKIVDFICIIITKIIY